MFVRLCVFVFVYQPANDHLQQMSYFFFFCPFHSPYFLYRNIGIGLHAHFVVYASKIIIFCLRSILLLSMRAHDSLLNFIIFVQLDAVFVKHLCDGIIFFLLSFQHQNKIRLNEFWRLTTSIFLHGIWFCDKQKVTANEDETRFDVKKRRRRKNRRKKIGASINIGGRRLCVYVPRKNHIYVFEHTLFAFNRGTNAFFPLSFFLYAVDCHSTVKLVHVTHWIHVSALNFIVLFLYIFSLHFFILFSFCFKLRTEWNAMK